MRLWAVALLGVLACGLGRPAASHEPTLAVLELRQIGDGAYLARWLIVPSDLRDSLQPKFPPQCNWDPPRLDCKAPGLEGQIGFMGLGTSQSAVLVRVRGMDGVNQSYTLTAVSPAARLFRGARSGWDDWAELIGTYFRTGVDHILRGPDHLLFVLGLIGIVGWTRKLAGAVTAFSVAHSITLAVAALDVVTPSAQAVTAVLALSVLFLAPEMVRTLRGEDSVTRRHPWLVAGGFGLLHGFGFASALTDAGLPGNERPYALLGFNVGVEVGQLLFVGLVWLLARAVRQLGFQGPRWVSLLPAYGVGSFGAAWVIGRTAVMLGVAAMMARVLVGALCVVLLHTAGPAWAHTTGHGAPGSGFAAGFAHPVTGIDSVAAMVAVGMWGAQLGAPAIWLLPVTFPLVMAFGGLLGITGAALPHLELGLGVSVLVLGVAVLAAMRPPLWVAGLLVAGFAVLHGYSHGRDLPAGADGLMFSLGFVIATGMLHAVGIGIGLVHGRFAGRVLLRGAGAAVAAVGVFMLWGAAA